MKLLIPISLNCLFVLLVWLQQRRGVLGRLSYRKQQLLIGLLFGAGSCFASSCGVELMGTVANVRDAFPLSAGFIFGAPAGILSGFIGGLYRWFSVYWGAGTYTRAACTLATMLAGLMAAGLRKLVFDDRRPLWPYAIVFTVVCEVVHMVLILLSHMSDSAFAFGFISGATAPMVVGNSVSVCVSVLLVSLLEKKTLRLTQPNEQIAQTFQRWLLACMLAAFLVTGLFTYELQNTISSIETDYTFSISLTDVTLDVLDASNKNLLGVAHSARDACLQGDDLETVAQKWKLSEVNIVSPDFVITRSSRAELVGLDLSEKQALYALQFLQGGESEYAESYLPNADNRQSDTFCKYAYLPLENGSFLQVGCAPEVFQQDIAPGIAEAVKNRHMGQSGFLVICGGDYGVAASSQESDPDAARQLAALLGKGYYRENEVYETSALGEPYLFSYNTAEGFFILGAMPERDATFMRDTSLYTSVFMQIIVFAILIVFIYALIKRVIINNLKKINDTLSEITAGNLEATVDVRSNEEFSSLSDDINSTVVTLKRYIAEAAARIDRELEYAAQIQRSALPTNFPVCEKYTVYAQMMPAKEVGGDFYDFYPLGDTRVAFLMADVSGKGIPAAMFMMTARTVLRDLAESGLEVNDIFTRANEKLCESNESGMFVTAWMGILDLETGRLNFVNAGHNPPLLLHETGAFSYLKTRPGFVLAGMEGIRYRVNELTLCRGDRIFLYTDGVTEATNGEEVLYGEERLLDFMNRHRDTPSTELLPMLKADLDGFADGAPQFDDITMLMLDYWA